MGRHGGALAVAGVNRRANAEAWINGLPTRLGRVEPYVMEFGDGKGVTVVFDNGEVAMGHGGLSGGLVSGAVVRSFRDGLERDLGA